MTKQLAPDIYRRTEWPQGPGRRRRGQDARIFGVLIGLSLSLLVANRLEQPHVDSLRMVVQDVSTPMLRVMSRAAVPALNSVRMFAEVREMADEAHRLRAENDRLKGWEARARALEQQSQALSQLARAADEPRIAFVTARVVSGQGGPFVRAALLDAGREQGLKPGYPVISAQGLTGRLIAVGERSARVLLLSDHNSRIPVSIGAAAARAVIQGDNSPLPKIAYLAADSRIKAGDEVFTSGVGGLFPRGLRIGTVVDTGETLRIEPATRLDRLEFVSVLFFEAIYPAVSEEDGSGEARAGLMRRTGTSYTGKRFTGRGDEARP